MKCEKCGVNITGNRRVCPLCGQKLSEIAAEEEDYAIFPRVAERLSYNLIVKITTFVALIFILVINIINYSFIPDLALYVPLSLAVGCAWIIIVVGVRKRKNIPKNILYEAIIAAVLCLIWDKVTGARGWSVQYVLPIMFASLNVFYFVMSYVDRNNQPQYNIYFIISLMGTAISIIFVLTGVALATPFVSIPIGVGLALLLAKLVFHGRAFLSELYRRLHV